MAATPDLFWRFVPEVRSRERTRFAFFAGLAALVSAAQTLGLVGSEALFLTRFGAAHLPETFIAAAALTVLGTFAYAAAVGRKRNDALYLWMGLGAALLLAAATAGAGRRPELVVPAIFCLYYVTQAIFQNHFYTFAGDYFDALRAKKLFPYFAIAASLGSALGAGLSVWISRLAEPVMLVAAWAAGLGAASLLLRLGRRPLGRWGPLGLEEADETSVEGMRGAVSSLRDSPLGRSLVLSAVGMVLALFVVQYVYSDIFARRFPETDSLAIFLGSYLLVTNAVEIAIGVAVTPWVIRRLGVPTANLIHPLLALLSFGALGLQYGQASGVFARVTREMIDNALGFPVRSLVINAMPPSRQGRVRAFLEGVVVYVGMAAAGAVLLALDRPDPALLCLAGGAAAAVFLAANLLVRRAYLNALVAEMIAGRPFVEPEHGAMGRWEVSRLADLWEGLLAGGARGLGPLLELAPVLAQRGILAPLARGASHSNPRVRRVCVKALATAPGEEVEGSLALALDDPDAEVRLAALVGLAARTERADFVSRRIRDRLGDDDPRVRAAAALHCGAEGEAVLESLIGSGDARSALAGLEVAPPSLLGAVRRRFGDADPALRAAALARAAEIASEAPLPPDALRQALADPDARVRRAALALLAAFPPGDVPELLARALSDVDSGSRRVAERALCELGPAGVAAALPRVHAECERAAEAALRVLAAAPDGRALLGDALHGHVRDLWFDTMAFQKLHGGRELAAAFLRAAYRDAIARHERITFRILELLEDASLILRVERALRFGSTPVRISALNVLSNLGDRESAELLVLMHEQGPIEERAARARTPLPAGPEEALAKARRSPSRWLRLAADASDREADPDRREEEFMERLLALGRVPLFATLSLEQLEALQRIAVEVEYLPGEVICREGEPGNELFAVTEGRVQIFLAYGQPGQKPRKTYEPGGTFGEMAIFGGERRTATAVSEGRSRLLRLDGGNLKELILQMPEISFEIFRTLTERVRKAEAQLTER